MTILARVAFIAGMLLLSPSHNARAYCLNDYWRFPLGEVDVYLHRNMDAFGDRALKLDVIEHQVRSAIRVWGERAPTNVRLRFAGLTDETEVTGAVVIQRESPSSGADAPCGSRDLACTYTNELTDGRKDLRTGAVVFFDPTVAFTVSGETDRYSFRNTVVHELGHTLGLDHPEKCAAGGRFTVMDGARRGQSDWVPSRDDIEGARAFNFAAGFLLEQMRYSDTGGGDTWEDEIEALDAPQLPLTVSRTTPTLATAGDRRLLAYPGIVGDRVRVLPGIGNQWLASHSVTSDDVGTTFAPVGVGAMGDDVLVAWEHQPPDEAGTIYYAISRDFGATFGVPQPLMRIDPVTSAEVPFRTVSRAGVNVTPDPGGLSWVVMTLDSAGQMALSTVFRDSGDSTLTMAIAGFRLSQRPQVVCGPNGDLLTNVPSASNPVPCLALLINLDAFNTVTHVPSIPLGGVGYLFPVALQTLLRTEQPPSLLWRPEAVERPIWFGYTLHGNENVFFFNHPRDAMTGWFLSSIDSISGQPLSAPSLGVTTTATGNDVLQFAIGQIFP